MSPVVVLGGLAFLAWLASGSSSPRRGAPSSLRRGRVELGDVERVDTPRGRVEMGPIRTTRDIQSARLGIGPDLWDDLNRWSAHRDSRTREPFRSIVGPVARIEAWLALVRGLGAEGSVSTLHDESNHMRDLGFELAADYAASLGRYEA